MIFHLFLPKSNQANAGIASQPCLTETQSPSAFWSKIKTQLEPKILEFTVKYNISTILSQMKSKRTKWPWLVGYVVAEEYICGKDGRIVLKDDSCKFCEISSINSNKVSFSF